jgi:ParB/RepB/Spo0J family partition protein
MAIVILKPGRIEQIPHAQLRPDPGQVRNPESISKEGLARLAASIKANGVVQPIVVRAQAGGAKYIIHAGERRWRAAGMAGLKAVPCILADPTVSADPIARGAQQIAENVEREALTPIDIAEWLVKLRDTEKKSANDLLAALAKRGITDFGEAKLDRLMTLISLPDWSKAWLRDRTISESIALEIVPFAKFAGVMKELQKLMRSDLDRFGRVTVNETREAISRALRDTGVVLKYPHGVAGDSAFSLDICKGCQWFVKLGKGEYCLNRKEWQRKQDEALEAKSARARKREEKEAEARGAGKAADRDNPDPTQVAPRKLKTNDAGIVSLKGKQWDTYKDLEDAGFDVASCEGCPHRFIASKTGTPENASPHCFHLPCYAQKEKAGRKLENQRERLRVYLEAWLRPRVTAIAAERLSAINPHGFSAMLLWLATGAIDRATSWDSGQRHETAAEKTVPFLAEHKLVDLPTLYEFGTKQLEDAHYNQLLRCAVQVMTRDQLRWFAHLLNFDLAAEGFSIDRAYLDMHRKAQLQELAKIAEPEATGDDPGRYHGGLLELPIGALKDELEDPARVKRIGVPENILAVYREPYIPQADEFDLEDDIPFSELERPHGPAPELAADTAAMLGQLDAGAIEADAKGGKRSRKTSEEAVS